MNYFLFSLSYVVDKWISLVSEFVGQNKQSADAMVMSGKIVKLTLFTIFFKSVTIATQSSPTTHNIYVQSAVFETVIDSNSDNYKIKLRFNWID